MEERGKGDAGHGEEEEAEVDEGEAGEESVDGRAHLRATEYPHRDHVPHAAHRAEAQDREAWNGSHSPDLPLEHLSIGSNEEGDKDVCVTRI